MWLLEKTANQRAELAVKLAKVISPKTALVLNEMYELNEHTPRPFTLELKKQNKKEMYGLEIGFGSGANAKSLLKELDLKMLYCVEPFIGKSYMQGGRRVYTYDGENSNFKQLSSLNNVHFIVDLSEYAAKLFSPNSLDFVYIDGNHSFEYVLHDLILYYPLVKKGGLIGGHDYYFGHKDGVIKAVEQFKKTHPDLSIQYPDFWFKK